MINFAKEEVMMMPEEHAVWTLIKELYLKDRQHPDTYRVTEALKRLARSEQISEELYIDGLADLPYHNYHDSIECPEWDCYGRSFKGDPKKAYKIFDGKGALFRHKYDCKDLVENLVRSIFHSQNSHANFDKIRTNLNELARWYDFNEDFLADDEAAFFEWLHQEREYKELCSLEDMEYDYSYSY